MLPGLLAVIGCASPARVTSDWPGDLPSRDHFATVWTLDEENQQKQSEQEYLGWVIRFYRGNALAPGWSKVEEDVLGRLPAADAERAAPRLNELGVRVAEDWAKDNACRKVSTRMLARWGDRLKRAAAQEQFPKEFDAVCAEVAGLLGGSSESTALGLTP